MPSTYIYGVCLTAPPAALFSLALAALAHDLFGIVNVDEAFRAVVAGAGLFAAVALIAPVFLALLFGRAFDQSVPKPAIERAAVCRVFWLVL